MVFGWKDAAPCCLGNRVWWVTAVSGPERLAGWFTMWALSSSVVLALVSVMIEIQSF